MKLSRGMIKIMKALQSIDERLARIEEKLAWSETEEEVAKAAEAAEDFPGEAETPAPATKKTTKKKG